MPAGDGLLLDSERERLVELVLSGWTSEQMDQQAKEFLLARSAMTSWESWRRDAGSTRFVLGNHRVFDLISQSETYEVLRGQNLFTGRVDVVKAMYRANNSVQRRARHMRKLCVQSALRSSQVVAVYDAGYHGTNFAVVEHVPGENLRTVVRRDGPLGMAAAATVLSEAVAGIGAVHALGLVFANLQPTKILCGKETTTIKLCDAGEGQPLGTVYELPPPSGRLLDFASLEVLAGGEITPASDVYSVGCVLYYAVTGKVPFPGGTDDDKRKGHLGSFPVDPRRLVDGLDDSFLEVIAAMMAKAPGDRIQSTAEVVKRLEPWARPE